MTETGATTAEYAVGTVAAASFGAVLVHLCRDGWIPHLLWDIVRHALRPGVLLDQLHHLPRLGLFGAAGIR